MLDVIGALLLGAICAADVTVLIGLAAIRPVAKFAAFVVAAAWISVVVVIAALGGFAPGATGTFPSPVSAFLVLIIGGLVAWFAWPAFRHALLSLPLTGLVGINAFRIGGICFLMLHHEGRLAAPFATSAGWGDIITGIAAIPLAAAAAWKGKLPRVPLKVWNAFGALDLIVAILLGGLSAPGTPFRLFSESPGTVVMGMLPWVGVPTLLVPLYLMTHLTIAVRLRSAARGHAMAQRQVDNQLQGSLTRTAA
jgi:hypothetical protein